MVSIFFPLIRVLTLFLMSVTVGFVCVCVDIYSGNSGILIFSLQLSCMYVDTEHILSVSCQCLQNIW